MPSSFPEHAIGWVYAGALDRTAHDFYAMTPDEIDLVINTRLWALDMMHEGTFDVEAFDKQRRAEIVEAATGLHKYRKVDCLFVSGDLIQFAMGTEWTERVRQDVQDAIGVPVTTPVHAACEAFKHLGVSKIAMASPWRPDQNAYAVQYFAECGIEIVHADGFMTNSPEDAMRLDRELSTSKALEVFEAADGAEGIYIACPLFRGASAAIAPLEEKTGVPVLSFYSPVIWRCLDFMGLQQPIPGYGRLLAGN